MLDVLRATTTIACALDRGAARVLPCLEVADARQLAATQPEGTFLLGGERGGRHIEGFDLGNSPAEYTSERIAGKTILFTTTNGTRAMHHCHQADEILLGSLVNAQAISDVLARRENVQILCAGTDGEITREDVLAAGAIGRMVMSQAKHTVLNDQAQIAVDTWDRACSLGAATPGTVTISLLSRLLADSCGGRNLMEIGMQSDIALAARLSSLAMVPIYRDGQVRPLSAPA